MKTFAKIKSGAFTLIELLAAMTITTVLVLVIVALTSRGVDIWRWVLQDVRTTTLARTAMDTMTKEDFVKLTDEEVLKKLEDIDVDRSFCVFEALKRGISVDVIHDITKIDKWFISKLNNLVQLEKWLAEGELTQEKYDMAKKYCYLDSTIERISGQKIKERRLAVYKMVDTCAAEFSASTPSESVRASSSITARYTAYGR